MQSLLNSQDKNNPGKIDLKKLFQMELPPKKEDKTCSRINEDCEKLCESSSLETERFSSDDSRPKAESEILREQMDKYQDFCQSAKVNNRFDENNDEFLTIVNQMKNNSLKCFKYNHCLDYELQKHISF